ncbi:hypothetical protein B0H19DRAFT_1262071 [Mycena capillaripes]|nr:hypothetical protein B0H19DRAFT_1262071 [Mycena capillaripes]
MHQGSATRTGQGTWLTLVEVGGLISLNFDSVGANSSIALSFTESPSFIRPTASNDSSFPDESRRGTPSSWSPHHCLVGFGPDPPLLLTVSNVSCAISFMPHADDLRAYTGDFTASDVKATKVDKQGLGCRNIRKL